MPYVGKNGSDAISFALKHVCRVLFKYNAKLKAAVTRAESDGVIDSTQATIANTFIDGASVICDVFILVASNSGI